MYIQISLKKVFEKIVFWHFQIKTHKAYINIYILYIYYIYTYIHTCSTLVLPCFTFT